MSRLLGLKSMVIRSCVVLKRGHVVSRVCSHELWYVKLSSRAEGTLKGSMITESSTLHVGSGGGPETHV